MTAAANSHRLTALLLQMTLITLSKECKQTLQQTRSAAVPLFDRGSKTTAQLLCYYGASLREKDRGGIARERERGGGKAGKMRRKTPWQKNIQAT